MSTKHIAIYARVSSSGQDLAAQEPDLQAWVDKNATDHEAVWYRDTFTGTTFARPGIESLEQAIRAGTVERIVVWRLDRLGRTAAQTLSFLSQLDESGVELVSIRDSFDARSATGRLLRTILAGFAEYEREVISERIRAGIAAAKAQGRRWGGRKRGHRPKLTLVRLQVIDALVQAGTSKTEIARQLGISRSTVYEGIDLTSHSEVRARMTNNDRFSR
jgi:DNA invertase Pin-like site-specific DNA recombinase